MASRCFIWSCIPLEVAFEMANKASFLISNSAVCITCIEEPIVPTVITAWDLVIESGPRITIRGFLVEQNKGRCTRHLVIQWRINLSSLTAKIFFKKLWLCLQKHGDSALHTRSSTLLADWQYANEEWYPFMSFVFLIHTCIWSLIPALMFHMAQISYNCISRGSEGKEVLDDW